MVSVCGQFETFSSSGINLIIQQIHPELAKQIQPDLAQFSPLYMSDFFLCHRDTNPEDVGS